MNPIKTCLTLVAVSFALLFSNAARADYSPPSLSSMIGTSDLVLLGTVSEVAKKTYTLAIEEVLVGSHKADTIEIDQFQDWTCSVRWTPYTKGERLLVFVERRQNFETGKLSYQTQSAGSEGEMPVLGKSVYYQGFPINGITAAKVPAVSKHFYGSAVKLTTMRAAIRGFGACFKLKLKANEHGWKHVEKATRSCTDTFLAEYRATSPVHEHLAKQGLAFIAP